MGFVERPCKSHPGTTKGGDAAISVPALVFSQTAVRLWLGLLTLTAGIALWFSARREREVVPAWVPSLAIGVAALGVSVLVASRGEAPWTYVSIAFSLVAITMIARVILRILGVGRRKGETGKR